MFELNYYMAWKNKDENELIQLCQSDSIKFNSLNIGDSNIKNCIFYNFEKLFFILLEESLAQKLMKDEEINELIIFAYEKNKLKLLLNMLDKISNETNIEGFLSFLIKKEIIYPDPLLIEQMKNKLLYVEKIEECIVIIQNFKIEEGKKDALFSILKFEDNVFDAWLKELDSLKKINMVRKLEEQMIIKENNKIKVKL